jgi:hypothetical protein
MVANQQRYINAISELTLKLLDCETSLRQNAHEIIQLRNENTTLNKQLAERDLVEAETSLNAKTKS